MTIHKEYRDWLVSERNKSEALIDSYPQGDERKTKRKAEVRVFDKAIEEFDKLQKD